MQHCIMKKTCATCDESLPIKDFPKGIQSDDCRKCRRRKTVLKACRKFRDVHREQERVRCIQYNKDNAEQRRAYNKTRDPYKERARRRLRGAVARGNIKKPSKCEKCGWEGRIQAHHEDYSKPLEVQWLCPICHGRHHSKYYRNGQ